MKATVSVCEEWGIFGPKTANIQKFHKIFSSDFSENLRGDKHSNEVKVTVFYFSRQFGYAQSIFFWMFSDT